MGIRLRRISQSFHAGDDSKAARYLDHPDPERALHEFRQSLHGVKVNIEKSDISNGKQNTHVTWSKDGVELESNGRLVLSGQDGKPQWLPSIFEAQLSDDSALFLLKINSTIFQLKIAWAMNI
nr:hypothetical protein [Corynebacterium striatum]